MVYILAEIVTKLILLPIYQLFSSPGRREKPLLSVAIRTAAQHITLR